MIAQVEPTAVGLDPVQVFGWENHVILILIDHAVQGTRAGLDQ